MISIAVIHNHDENKISYIKQNFSLLKEYKLEANIHYYGWQPKINKHGFFKVMARDIEYAKIGINHAKYKNLSILYRLIFPTIVFRSVLIKYIKNIDGWKRSSQIETFLTNKHVLSWQNFLESSDQMLMVMEDDIVFKTDSFQRVINIIDKYINSKEHLYIDLAGGCNISDLRVNRLIKKTECGSTHYIKPVTNTTCCYLINRPMAELLISELIEQPSLRTITPDHMINALLMKKKWNESNNISIHFEPTIFEHGSVSGKYSSTIR